MNPDSFIQLAQKGLRVTLGATSALIETLQDPSRREEKFSRLRTEFSQLTEEWEAKGEVTEREARDFVDNMLSQRFNRPPSTASGTASGGSTPPAPSAPPAPDVQQDLQELTEQLAAIRSELEALRNQQQDS